MLLEVTWPFKGRHIGKDGSGGVSKARGGQQGYVDSSPPLCYQHVTRNYKTTEKWFIEHLLPPPFRSICCKHIPVNTPCNRACCCVRYTATRLPSSTKNASGPTAYAANKSARCALLGHASAPVTSGRPCQLQNVCTREVTTRLRHDRKTAAAIDPNAVVYNSWNATVAAALTAL
jgi:hypothetical protein